MSVEPISDLPSEELEGNSKVHSMRGKMSKVIFTAKVAAIWKGEYTEAFLYDALYPLLIAMECFGLYHTRHDKHGKARFLTQIYCTVPAWITLSTLVRQFMLFNKNDDFSSQFFSKMINVVWLTWCLSGVISCFKAWFYEDKAPAFFVSFNRVVESCEMKHKCFKSLLRRRAIVATCMSVGFIVTNVAISGYMFFATEFLENMKAPTELFYSLPPWGQTFATCVLMLAQAYHTACWLFPLAFGHCVSLALRLELMCFNKALSDEITDEGTFKGSLDRYRIRHQLVSRLIEKADGVLGFQISVTLTWSMALLILLIISVLWDPSISTNAVYLVPYLYWIGMCCIFAGLVLFDGASLNDAVSIFLKS
jgi:hypothetical protein